MDERDLNRRLDQLQWLRDAGQKALDREKSDEESDNDFDIGVWMAAVSDTLKDWPGVSEINGQIQNKRAKISEEDRQTTISSTLQGIDYAISGLSSLRDKREELVRQREDMENLSYGIRRGFEELERKRDEYIQEARENVIAKAKRSTWIRIQAILIVAMVGLVVFGAFRIDDFVVDLNQLSDQAIEMARQDISNRSDEIINELDVTASAQMTTLQAAISEQSEELQTNLSQQTITETKRITDATDDLIENLDDEFPSQLNSLTSSIITLRNFTRATAIILSLVVLVTALIVGIIIPNIVENRRYQNLLKVVLAVITAASIGSLIYFGFIASTFPTTAGVSLSSTSTEAPTPTAPADPLVNITILQLNDVYEIEAVSGGTQGGLARVAKLREQLHNENPNTITILAGDLLSPSALGFALGDDEQGIDMRGKQMVDVMNLMGLNYATFGNHEFDLEEDSFLARMRESDFTWVSSNIVDVNDRLFPNQEPYVTFTITNDSGNAVQVGIIGLTIDSNIPDGYVKYQDVMEAAETQVTNLKDRVDILIAVTHLSLEQDIKLARKFPEIDLILGGHEHENQGWRSVGIAPIFKADANARTVYIHDLYFNIETADLEINSTLQPVPDATNKDIVVSERVDYWFAEAFADNDPRLEVVATVPVPLDGLESSVRNQPTCLTEFIAEGIKNTAGTELALFNSGAIRIDDILQSGDVTQYDILRILPYPGTVMSIEIQGGLLAKVLDWGNEKQGTGDFLQKTSNISWLEKEPHWAIDGELLHPDRNYTLAVNDFMLFGSGGYEPPLKIILGEDYEGLLDSLEERENPIEIQDALINQLRVISDQVEQSCNSSGS